MKVAELSAELEGLEESLNALDETILVRFRNIYQSCGAEQFRPNRNRVQCECLSRLEGSSNLKLPDPTRADVYEKLVEEEKIAHGGKLAGRVLLDLVVEGIDLDSKW